MKTQLLNATLAIALTGYILTGCAANKSVLQTAPATAGGQIVMLTAAAADEDPLAAGRAAAEALQRALGATTPHAILLVESYEGLAQKKLAVAGVASVFPGDIIFGGATYGMFTQSGSHKADAVSLLAIAGDGLSVTAALSEKMGAAGLSLETDEAQLTAALNAGGAKLARQLPGLESGALLLLMADAHSPRNQLLIDGVQSVAGKKLPITGGSVCKNDGQSFIYYRGRPYTDSAFGLLLTGDLKIAQTGHQAKANDAVIATAKQGSADALTKLGQPPFALIAYNCAGRMGKLDRLADELEAMQASVGKQTPLFGCYCAGEFGPADDDAATGDTSTGRGWHVMFSALGK